MSAESLPNSTPSKAGGQTPRWLAITSSLLFIVFCVELGMFLLVYPWLEMWNTNYFVQLRPEWKSLLGSSAVRGAVSGLGILNLFIAVSEIFRLRRFAHPDSQE